MDTHDALAQLAQALEDLAEECRRGLRPPGWMVALLGLLAAGMGWLFWYIWQLTAASAVHTQALLDLLRRPSP
jgi:hypothetical protein